MTNKEFVLDSLRAQGRNAALELQNRSDSMTGTELYSKEEYLPEFYIARKTKNMLERPIGFVCKSSAGRVVKLIQPYDSDIYTDEPENLPAQWGFKWSTDPKKAKPFVALSTSPYMKGDCCSENDTVYRSKMDNNVFSPSAYSNGWEVCVV